MLMNTKNYEPPILMIVHIYPKQHMLQTSGFANEALDEEEKEDW